MFSGLSVGLQEVPLLCGRQFLEVRLRSARSRPVWKLCLEQDLPRWEALGKFGAFPARVRGIPSVNIYGDAGI